MGSLYVPFKGDRRFVGRVDGGVSAFQMGLIHIIAGMMGAGVFERYPRLRVAFGESGAGWLAYALHRMDFEFEDRFCDLMHLQRAAQLQ
jgi:hypothetical protein